MSPSSLENLPLLALELICDYLAACDPKRTGLFAFSLTSKRCCDAATRQRFQRVVFRAGDVNEFSRALQQWSRIIQRDGRAALVRQIKITSRTPTTPTRTEADELLLATRRAPKWEFPENPDDEREFWEEDYFLGPPGTLFKEGGSVHRDTEENDGLWVYLAQFIKSLSRLSDLTYDHIYLFPEILLKTLHQYHPECRLHIRHFNFPSLRQRKGQLHDIDPYEYALATSPCLYRIKVQYSNDHYIEKIDYSKEAVLAMVSGLAPKLRHVEMQEKRRPRSSTYRLPFSSPRPPWRGFFVDSVQPSSSLGSIQGVRKLRLISNSESGFSQLLIQPGNCTDFSKLQSLDLGLWFNLEAAQILTRMAENKQLRSLRTLTLYISIFSDVEGIQLDTAVGQLLTVLHPLQNLRLSGKFANETFLAILHCHGGALRELRFLNKDTRRRGLHDYILTGRRVQELQRCCPNLQKLELYLHRTKGDKQEVDIYRVLREFSRLEHLSLFIDCWVIEDQDADVFDPLPLDQARDLFINMAIDSSLAISIFHAIFDKVPPGTTQFSSPHLSLFTAGGTRLGAEPGQRLDIEFIAKWIGRSWVCERTSTAMGVDVRETGKAERESLHVSMEPELADSYLHGAQYEKIWKELWPEKTGDWREDWSSFPLWDGE